MSNRHCLIFHEIKDGGNVAVLQDLSSNGTFVNESLVGRNKHRELHEGDEIAILDQTRFIFRYPQSQQGTGFRRQYRLLDQLGRGHFATVYLCVEKSSGFRYAVKRFEKKPGEANKMDNLKQEIGVLMSVSHPNVLCLKDSFEEDDGVYIVLELAPEGELFNWIVMKQKLTEAEARKVFIQLFQGIKYLVRMTTFSDVMLTVKSTREGLCIVTLNQRTSYSWTKSCLSSWQILDWLRSLESPHSQRHCKHWLSA